MGAKKNMKISLLLTDILKCHKRKFDISNESAKKTSTHTHLVEIVFGLHSKMSVLDFELWLDVRLFDKRQILSCPIFLRPTKTKEGQRQPERMSSQKTSTQRGNTDGKIASQRFMQKVIHIQLATNNSVRGSHQLDVYK